MEKIDKLMNTYQSLKSKRSIIDNTFQDIADYVLLNREDFHSPGQIDLTRSQRPNSFKSYSNIPNESCGRLVKNVFQGLSNPGSKWFEVRLDSEKQIGVTGQRYLDEVSRVMMSIINNPRSNFYTHWYSVLWSVFAYGTGCMFVDSVDEEIKFSAVHISKLDFTLDIYDNIDKIFVTNRYTYEQVSDVFGREKLSDKTRSQCIQNPLDDMEVIHIVCKNTNPKGKTKNFPYLSLYVEKDTRHVISEKGFYKNPYIIVRCETYAGDKWGRSPSWNCMAQMKQLSAVIRDGTKGFQLSALPPQLLTEDAETISEFDIMPNMLLHGMLNFDGTAKIRPLEMQNGLDKVLTFIQMLIEQIRQSYYVEEFYFKEGTPITATEAVQRQEARAQSLAPISLRLQNEGLNVMIEILHDILKRDKKLPIVPEELKNKKIKIMYLNPLANLQKMQDVVSFQRAMQVVAPISQLNPEVLDGFKLEEAGQYIGLATSMPAVLLNSQEEIDQKRAIRAQQQQMQQQMQLASYADSLNKPLS